MSATDQPKEFMQYFDGVKTTFLSIQGKSFPVETLHLEQFFLKLENVPKILENPNIYNEDQISQCLQNMSEDDKIKYIFRDESMNLDKKKAEILKLHHRRTNFNLILQSIRYGIEYDIEKEMKINKKSKRNDIIAQNSMLIFLPFQQTIDVLIDFLDKELQNENYSVKILPLHNNIPLKEQSNFRKISPELQENHRFNEYC